MKIVFEQVMMLVIFVAIGYILGKRRLAKEEHTKILSQLLVFVVAPCSALKTFSNGFTPTYLKEHYDIFVCSVVVLIILAIVMNFVSKLFSKEKYQRCIYEYSLIIPNTGYIGYPLAEALLGEGCINYMVFTLPLSIYIYTIAYAKLSKSGLNLKKLINPMIIATLLGMVIGLTGIELPSVLTNVISSSAACMGPVSMLMTGVIVSGFSLKHLLFNAKIYPVVALRLLVTPFVLWLIGRNFLGDIALMVMVLTYSLPCGLNTVVFPRLVDEDCHTGAGIALVSTVLSCITLPIMLSLVSI